LRTGSLDKGGAEAVGGVVVTRYGANPLAVINNVKKKIEELAPAMPAKARIDLDKVSPGELRRYASAHGFEAYKGPTLDGEAWLGHLRAAPRDRWPKWATISTVTIEPFYDRTGLIHETLGTLNDALVQEILVTLLVVIVMMFHLRASALIGSMLPLAVLTAVATTVVGFLPVFAMSGAEGKLFKPLAFTKTFAMISSIVIALTVLPSGAMVLFCWKARRRAGRWIFYGGLVAAGAVLGAYGLVEGMTPIVVSGAELHLRGRAYRRAAGVLPSLPRDIPVRPGLDAEPQGGVHDRHLPCDRLWHAGLARPGLVGREGRAADGEDPHHHLLGQRHGKVSRLRQGVHAPAG
jgi:hypothetical protein